MMTRHQLQDLVELMASKLAEAAANPSSATLQVIEDVVDAMVSVCVL